METIQTVHLEEIGGKVWVLSMNIRLKINKDMVIDYTDVFLLTDFTFCRFTLLLGPCLPRHMNSPSTFKVCKWQNLYSIGDKLIFYIVSNIYII